jgi:beta-galactosidase
LTKTWRDGPSRLQSGNLTYLGGWPDPQLLRHILLARMLRRGRGDARSAAGHPDRQAGTTRFVFNHGPDPVEFEGRVLPPAVLVAWSGV